MSLKAKWQDWYDKTTEDCFVQFEGERIRATGVIKGKNPEFQLQYKITLSSGWVFREAEIQSKDAAGTGRQIFLSSDGRGNWMDYKNNKMPELEGAIDIDFAITPFTNTLPVKRLQIERGESADIQVAMISWPDLAITSDNQRYTCLEPGSLYRLESLTSDFSVDIEFGEDGMVSNYPNMFKRTA